MKKVNYKVGALKRKYKLGRGDYEPGTFISKINNTKGYAKGVTEEKTKTQVAIRGLI